MISVMSKYIVQVRVKRRKEFPSTFYLEASPEEAKRLEDWIRELFEQGVIKDFLFQPIESSEASELADYLHTIDKRFT